MICPFDTTYRTINPNSNDVNFRINNFYYEYAIPTLPFGQKAYMLKGGKLVAIIPIACVLAEHWGVAGTTNDWLLRANVAGEGIKEFFINGISFFESLDAYDAYMSTNGRCGLAKWFTWGDKSTNARISQWFSTREHLKEINCWYKRLVRFVAKQGAMRASEVTPKFTLWCDVNGIHCDVDTEYNWNGTILKMYDNEEDALRNAKVTTIVDFDDVPTETEQTIEFSLNITCSARIKDDVIRMLKANTEIGLSIAES